MKKILIISLIFLGWMLPAGAVKFDIPSVGISGSMTSSEMADVLQRAGGQELLGGRTASGLFLRNVVDDTTPTLGGNLDGGGFNITNLGNITVSGCTGCGGSQTPWGSTIQGAGYSLLNAGPIQLATSTTSGLLVVENNNASHATTTLAVYQRGTGDIFNFYDSGTNVLTLKDGGNLGVGSSTPSQLLSVGNNFSVDTAGSATSSAMAITGVAAPTGSLLTANALGQLANATLATSTDTNLGLKITNSGNAYTFTTTWNGTLAVSRLATLNGFGLITTLAGGDLVPVYQDTSGLNKTISWTNMMGEITDLGTITGSGGVVVQNTTSPQLSVNYDASNLWRTSVGATGQVIFTRLGSALDRGFEFQDTLSVATSTTETLLTINSTNASNASTTLAVYQAGTGDIFRLYNGANLRVVTTAAGNVGIGTTTPWGLLSINPNNISGPSFVIGSSTATHLVVTNAGNVGVATSTPEAKLDVWGTSSGKILTLFSNAGTKFLEMLNTGVTTLLGTWNFSGATVIEHRYTTFTYATSTAWTGTTTIPYGVDITKETWSSIDCYTDAGTLNVQPFSIQTGTTKILTNMFSASTATSTQTFSANNAITVDSKRGFDIGTPASSPKSISCTLDKIINQ